MPPEGPGDRFAAERGRAWPFEEARKVLSRFEAAPPGKGYALFETGYGPSGLPHIGTFGEVVRTTMVRNAFRTMSDLPTRLFAFSDDMDGLRKVPDNIPNGGMLAEHIGRPLTAIPDPFGTHPSFGQHNNARLRAFLDSFGFEYEFISSTERYKAGAFDATLKLMLANYERVKNVILPTLGPERRATYSPFLPISPKTGRVLQVPILEVRLDSDSVVFRDEDGALTEVPVTGGRCKLQWKADWAMRWIALDVDYEMSGKDLIDSVKLSSAICRVLGTRPPEGFTYELFLDANGEKISKSRGNGLTVDEWLRYGPPESLALFMYNQPKAAKRLHFDVIPRQVDDYLAHVAKFPEQAPPTSGANAASAGAQQLDNPAWHIHGGHPPAPERDGLSFSILMNLVGVANTEDKAVLWGFITRYAPNATPASCPMLDRLVDHAIAYYRDFVKPARRFRAPTDAERAALDDLVATIERLPAAADAEAIQFEVYEVGKRHGFAADLRGWFKVLYELLFGTEQGPRLGSFTALYGRAETVALIRAARSGALAA
ncbi:MAG: lysine--tRNA ligase [Alphaproteobacteria bacterium]|nr:lysine--tRNA ligase [Alphaproteobacteria bacterium]